MNNQTEIPGFTLRLRPFRDETLFSWCSRYHRISANGRDAATCMQLFGDRRIGTAHDLPARLDALVTRSGGAIGDAVSIIQQRTLLPFYLPFRSPRLAALAHEAMRGPSIGSLKYQLGLLTSGLGAAHPLKSCPRCIAVDQERHGWAYWHRDHQLPGTWICTSHQVHLRISPCKLDQRARFAWVLPSPTAESNSTAISLNVNDLESTRWLIKLAAMGAELVQFERGTLNDPVRLGLALRRRLIDLNLASPSGRIRWRDIEPSLDLLSKRQLTLPEMQHLADKELLKGQLLRALSGRSVTHPLRWLLWCSVWFKDLQALKVSYDESAPTEEVQSAPVTTPTTITHGPNAWQATVLSEACAGVISMSRAAQQAGVTYSTFTAWASAQGTEAPHRPQKLTPERREAIVTRLQLGHEKCQLATGLGLSIETITRVLRTTPGLQEQWHHSRFDLRRAAARSDWLGLRQGEDGLTAKAARRVAPATYAWLYRNDRQWLEDSGQACNVASRGNHATQRLTNAQHRRSRAVEQLRDRLEGLSGRQAHGT
ncbi:TnsD family Tn7-like transposition protein [Hydrogenophaga sp. 2FB]|uniref:TnsD family Tn7-like transposition protein n=1 Tax=Hydrogenophaga sp. 2FB TaxID=2502187 RepID=UPI0010F60FC2